MNQFEVERMLLEQMPEGTEIDVRYSMRGHETVYTLRVGAERVSARLSDAEVARASTLEHVAMMVIERWMVAADGPALARESRLLLDRPRHAIAVEIEAQAR